MNKNNREFKTKRTLTLKLQTIRQLVDTDLHFIPGTPNGTGEPECCTLPR